MKLFLFLAFILDIRPVIAMQSGWTKVLDKNNSLLAIKDVFYENSRVYLKISCDSSYNSTLVTIRWTLAQFNCWQGKDIDIKMVESLVDLQNGDYVRSINISDDLHKVIKFQHDLYKTQTFQCQRNVYLDASSEQFLYELHEDPSTGHIWTNLTIRNLRGTLEEDQETTVWSTGVYGFMLMIIPDSRLPDKYQQFSAKVSVLIRPSSGYLSPLEWPMLPASGVLAFVYLILCSSWTFLWIKAHQHTEKIHIVIGVVTLAGAIIHTITFVQKSAANNIGYSYFSMDVMFELLSVVQSLLVVGLILAVSYGYGLTRFDVSKSFKMVSLSLLALLFSAAISVFVFENWTSPGNQLVKKLYIVSRVCYFITYATVILTILATGISTLYDLCSRKHSHKIKLFTFLMAVVSAQFLSEIVIFAIFWLDFSTLLMGCSNLWRYQWIAPYSIQIQLCVLMMILMIIWRPADAANSYSFFPLASNDIGTGEAEDDSDADNELNRS